MTQQQPGQWLASKLIGTTVAGANNESIGDVNDVLMDRNGHAVAVVVGVGGFLGIGEKDVAVPFQQLEFASRGATATSGSGSATTGSTGSTATTGSGTGATASGSNASSSASGPGGSASATSNGAPERIVLRMTKQDLQNAPAFTRGGSGSGGSGGDRGTTGNAPAAPGGGNAAPR